VDHDNYSVPGKLIPRHALTSTRDAIHLFKPSLAHTIRQRLFVMHGVTGTVHRDLTVTSFLLGASVVSPAK